MFKRQESNPGLDNLITQLESYIQKFEGDTQEYAKSVNQLDTLYKIKTQSRPDRVSADTLALIGGNLLGIILIVGHERAHVVTSKALSFILKAR